MNQLLKKYWAEISLAILMLGFFVTVLSLRTVKSGVFISPDEVVNLRSLITFSQTGNFKLVNNYFNYPNLQNIHPAGYLPSSKFLVPTKFFGMSLIYGVFYKFIGYGIVLFTPLVASIGILVMYLFTLLVSQNKKTALVSAVLLSAFAPYFWWSQFPYLENIFGSVLFFTGFYLLSLFVYRNDSKLLYLSALILSLSCGVRPDYSVLYIFPLLIFVPYYFQKIGTKRLLIAAAIFSAVIIPVFCYNQSLFGSFLMTGSRYASKWSAPVPLDIRLRSIDILFANFSNTFIKICPLFLLSLIGAAFYLRDKRHNGDKFPQVYFIYLLGSIFVFSYVLLSGVGPKMPPAFAIQESYIRYALPIYLCSLPGLALLIARLKNNHKVVLISFYFVFSAIFLNNQITYLKNIEATCLQEREDIITNTEKNAMIYINSDLSKIVYPDRQTALIDDNGTNTTKITSQSIEDFHLLKKDIPVYIYITSSNVNLVSLDQLLSDNSLKTQRTASSQLLKIVDTDDLIY